MNARVANAEHCPNRSRLPFCVDDSGYDRWLANAGGRWRAPDYRWRKSLKSGKVDGFMDTVGYNGYSVGNVFFVRARLGIFMPDQSGVRARCSIEYSSSPQASPLGR